MHISLSTFNSTILHSLVAVNSLVSIVVAILILINPHPGWWGDCFISLSQINPAASITWLYFSSIQMIVLMHVQQKLLPWLCSNFFFSREKVTALEVRVAKCLEVLSTDFSVGKNDHPEQTGSTSGVTFIFPTWHVSHFLSKLRSILHGGGLQMFLTKQLKVLYTLIVVSLWYSKAQ